MSRPRKRLLMQVFNHILAHPSTHRQATWGVINKKALEQAEGTDASPEYWDNRPGKVIDPTKVDCGTVACFAGWTVTLAGDKILLPYWLFNTDGSIDVEEVDGWGQDIPVNQVVTDDNQATTIAARAQELLGLNYDQADTLFSASNTVEDLRRGVLMLLNGEELPDYLWPESGRTYRNRAANPNLQPIRYDRTAKEYV